MGLLGKSKDSNKSSPSSLFEYCVDREPNPLYREQYNLVGWAISSEGTPRVSIEIDQKKVFETNCIEPRIDVYKSFPQAPGSLTPGFTIPFPLDCLEQISSGRIKAFLESNSRRECCWEWAKNAAEETNEDALAVLSAHFSRLQHEFAPSDSHSLSSETKAIHFLLRSYGCYSNLKQLSEEVSNIISQVPTNINFTGCTVIASGQAIPAEVQQLKLPDKLQLKIIPEENFTWEAIGCLNDKQALVFYAEENICLDFLNFPAFLKDFYKLAICPLLMPSIYGEENGVFAPSEMPLDKLNQCSKLSTGEKLPALYPTQRRGPAWLSSLSFLRAYENRAGTSNTLESRLPPEQHICFPVDLRQPIIRRQPEPNFFSEVESNQIKHLLKTEIQFESKHTDREAIFILPEVLQQSSLKCGSLFQVVALARSFKTNGNRVRFINPARQSQQIYVEGILSEPLSNLLGEAPSRKNGIVIANDWKGLQTANVLKYIFGLKVSYFIQHLEYKYAEIERAEDKDPALWALRGNYKPIVSSKKILEEAPGLTPCLEQAELIQAAINKNIFFPWPVKRQPNSILCLLGNHGSRRIPNIDILSQALKKLKESEQNTTITLVGYSKDKPEQQQLFPFSDQVFGEVPDAELARLYSTHEIMLDYSLSHSNNITPLEAMACGAVPVLDARNFGRENIDKNKDGALVSIQDAQALSKQIATLLSDSKELNKRSKNGVIRANDCPQTLAGNTLEKISEAAPTLQTEKPKSISLVIPVYNALDALTMCLKSVYAAVNKDMEIVLVNDGSDAGTSEFLRQQSKRAQVNLIELTENRGFVQACIAGIKAADPERDIILINSDVVLSVDAIRQVQKAAYARPDIGLASALSSNSPHLQLNINPGDSLATAAKRLNLLNPKPAYPSVITPEGQLLYIRRSIIDRFGFFDTVYNRGFYEESDYCMRVFLNGVDLVCADDTLITHRRSASFGEEGRTLQKNTNRPLFEKRWGESYRSVHREFIRRDPLQKIRSLYQAQRVQLDIPHTPFALKDTHKNFALRKTENQPLKKPLRLFSGEEVVFLLPGAILGGGAISVLQHANEMLSRGIEARVLSLKEPEIGNYPEIAPIIPITAEQLADLNWTDQKLVATFWTTSYLVKSLCLRFPNLKGYYYIQDYEPWFYSHPEEFSSVQQAENSYSLGLQGVAKTPFLKNLVKEKHGVEIELVTAGIDHGVFYPGKQQSEIGRPRLSALYRLRTTRRGNKELIEVLRELKIRLPELEVQLFGEREPETLPEDLRDYVSLRGHLLPWEVAELYRKSDVVMDLSYWHGFGRMGLEGMACGAVPILSRSGGVDVYAKDEQNSIMVDRDNLGNIVEKTISILKNRPKRLELREQGLQTAKNFTEDKATRSWLDILGYTETARAKAANL